jgi:putative FmdB family regulatory protein
MPIYEFVCESCGRVEEHLQKLSDPPPAACGACGAKMAKIMSRNSFQLKGGGWYKDLYSSAPANPTSGSAGENAKSASSASDTASSSAPATAAAAPSSAPAAAPSAPAPAAAKADKAT